MSWSFSLRLCHSLLCFSSRKANQYEKKKFFKQMFFTTDMWRYTHTSCLCINLHNNFTFISIVVKFHYFLRFASHFFFFLFLRIYHICIENGCFRGMTLLSGYFWQSWKISFWSFFYKGERLKIKWLDEIFIWSIRPFLIENFVKLKAKYLLKIVEKIIFDMFKHSLSFALFALSKLRNIYHKILNSFQIISLNFQQIPSFIIS